MQKGSILVLGTVFKQRISSLVHRGGPPEAKGLKRLTQGHSESVAEVGTEPGNSQASVSSPTATVSNM